MTNLKNETREKLKRVATPTLMTALYRRGFRNQWIQGVSRINPKAGTMVGEAFTLRYVPAREELNQLEVFRNPDHPQRKAVEICPEGAVLVMDSRKDPRAASAGSILISRLMIRGGQVWLPMAVSAIRRRSKIFAYQLTTIDCLHRQI